MPCVNDCNSKGKCVAGWCHCERGFWGSDCSLSWGKDGRPVLLEGRYKPRERRPRVYVYDIMPNISMWHNPERMDRPLHWVFLQRLLGSGVQTADGDDADWFYVPLRLRATSEGGYLMKAISYIRKNWPWYNRYQGQRHFVIHTGDTGRGEVLGPVRDATPNITWLHHWGLIEDYKLSGWRKAHRPGKDVVVPVFISAHTAHGHYDDSALHPLAPRWPRNGTFLFAGRICGDNSKPDTRKPWPHCGRYNAGYSMGVRQLVHYHHWNRTGYKIVGGDPTYHSDMITYKYCLAPTGGGHGHRQTLAALMACLPVLIGDNVLQPFEPELDWSAFSVSVAQKDIPRLHEILDAITPQQYERMQDVLRCSMQHLFFTSMAGSFMREGGRYDAFEMILEVLRMQQAYPGADPKDYVRLDARFREFVNCGMDDVHAYGGALREAYYRERPEELDPDGSAGLPAQLAAAGLQAAAVLREAKAAQLRKRQVMPVQGQPSQDMAVLAAAQALQALPSERQRVLKSTRFKQVLLMNVGKPGKPAQVDQRLFNMGVAAYLRSQQANEKEPPSGICSISAYDPPAWACLEWAKMAERRYAWAPGGQACSAPHVHGLEQCPRLWP